ncbi:uncharacterized protein LOC121736454 [Aricia agestis]|uniref:uncharacterized protein LOC121736454 n=1 Tax=Aricia agestis TaxID=91739 RepID=UPI001C205C58|nr:uncharacterized protein LOC121736454 [Aricia agestis]
MNLTLSDKSSATLGISTVDNFKENSKKEMVNNTNKISRYIGGHSTNFTTKSLTNRAEVKREADNKLVFWDRVYDDKNSAKNSLDGKKTSGGCIKKRKMQKSKDWFKAQIHNLIGRRKKPNKIKKNYSNNGLSTKVINLEESLQNIPNWRKIRTLKHDNDKDMDNIFKKLNAKMETVCREAAYAIQNTKNIKVRESKADIATSTLMQRLVRMMRDLVDMQVQEKTCVELPPDLRQFLEWLVPPVEANPQADDLNPDISDYVAIKKEFDGFDKSDDVTDQPLSFAEDTEAEVDKIQCMETIRAVQDLVDQYEGLSSDDKYKLSGVKDYLQRQLQYLNKLVGDIGTEINYQEADDRVKRETYKNIRKLDKITSNSRLGYFMQRLKIKHNKATTQAINNNVTVKDKEIISYTGHKLKNINDVYNRALGEAKKLTTENVYK